ncbi:murein hydrolase activator EnvC family protein [Aliiruegeria sabulilitoris]|uniref:murein hydrolase activator EnvC family protein n=1 Tax=Aliiruegeria sabulilitoris TaxID=1510458 RepID=UPI00082F1848|nr:peptidoglycan DD-metalloendopeptidase family protein [Aliiruegeria sabulilitoris]NDR57802.1 peptidoglycan DD-metalloendopeptidase family protein [Pseudoruegeria sp. M32A2M]
MRKICLLAASLLFAGAAGAQTDLSDLAERAASQLADAARSLEAAEGARDRVRALTATVQAYEEGLSALRAGMRQAASEERVQTAVLAAREEDVARLLGALTAIEGSPAPLLLLHPSGPLGTARSGMMMSEITPELMAEADALRTELQKLAVLRALQESARDSLLDGMRGAQDARTALSQAMADRTDLPMRFTADPERMRQLTQTAASMDDFATGLKQIGPGIADVTGFEDQKGTLPLPVQSVLLRGYDEADAAGVARPGLLLATRPGALVTAPWDGTIRYVGPLLDYGNVIILEPADGILLVLAGLGIVYGKPGGVVQAGDALGLMGGAADEEFLAGNQVGGGTERSETLYMELRQGELPVDPAEWFAPTKGD